MHYVIERQDGPRWLEAGDIRAVGPGQAIELAAAGPGTYRARVEGDPPEMALLYRVQLSGRAVAIPKR